ncbi:MAG: hypothetical protein PVG39_08480 [Desulfobacteraceae bacterium]|jgi:hypothetical protein
MKQNLKRAHIYILCQFLFLTLFISPAFAWFGKTHLAIAKAAGYKNWYNAAAADLAKLKAGDIEQFNHYVNNQRSTVITPEMVLEQADRYNDPHDRDGHLYGAIVASVRRYIKDKKEGRYPEDNMAYCAHYVGDLSMPLHNIAFTPYNKKNHMKMDGIIEREILNNVSGIKINRITIKTEKELAKEVARIANISMNLGFRLEDENRMITKEEAYRQVSYSVSLLKAILEYVDSE